MSTTKYYSTIKEKNIKKVREELELFVKDYYMIHALLLNMDFKYVPKNPRLILMSTMAFVVKLSFLCIPLVQEFLMSSGLTAI